MATEHHDEHDHGHDDDLSACGHEHAPVRLWQTLVGVVFVLNAFILDSNFFDRAHTVASVSAFIGAIILGYPIVDRYTGPAPRHTEHQRAGCHRGSGGICHGRL